MLALYKEQSMLLSLQRQHRKLSSFISKWGLVSAAPCSLIKPDQLSTTPAEKGLKTVSFSNIQGNVKFLGRIWWTIQWATAAWMKSANKKTKEKDTKNKGKSFYHLTMKGVADVTQKHFHYRRKKKIKSFPGAYLLWAGNKNIENHTLWTGVTTAKCQLPLSKSLQQTFCFLNLFK